jgi:DNA topoisomerase-1
VRFEFKGKSGITHRVTVSEPRIARIVRRCLDIPGHDLFSYLDEEGAPHPIRSTDVNAYLQEAAGADFTAKDYRTWAASVLAMTALAHASCETKRAARANIVTAMKGVAARLGNTPAICRKSYVHPALLDAYQAGTLRNGVRRAGAGMDLDEARFLRFLRNLSP